MTQVPFGFPFPLPPDVRMATYSNENIDFNADLTSSLQYHDFYLPTPGSIDVLRQTHVVHALEFIMQGNHYALDDEGQNLAAFISVRGELPNALTSRPVGADNADTWNKTLIGRNISFGRQLYQPTDSSLAGPYQWSLDTIQDAIWFPPAPLDQSRPTHIFLYNNSVTIDPATQDETLVDFTLWEQVYVVEWFTVRNLTQAEIDRRSRNASDRFAILNA